MASYFSYPGYTPPQAYAQTPDIAGDFFRSLKAGTDVRNEADAANALAEYVKSLYAGKTPPAPSLMDLAPAAAPAAAPTTWAPATNQRGATNLGDQGTLASPAAGPGYFANIAQSESGNNPNATNPNSSAKGPYQILDGTAADIQKNHPDLGLTGDWRNDPAQSLKGYQAFTGDNARVLSKNGVPVNPGNLYLGAYFGGQGAVDLLSLPDNTPMTAAVSADVIQANPSLANQTVGDVKAWAAQKATNGRGGYQAPSQDMAQVGAPAELPPQEVLTNLLRNPETRAFGAQLVQTVQQQNDPGKRLQTMKVAADLARGDTTELQKNYKAATDQGYQGSIVDFAHDMKATTGGVDNSGDIGATVDAIVSGQQPPVLNGLYKNTLAVRAELARRGYDYSKANQDWTATQKYLATLNGPQQTRLRQATRFVSESIPNIQTLADQWDGGQFPILNKVNLTAAVNGAYGPDAARIATLLNSQVADLTSELGTVYKGGNSSTDESLKLAGENLKTDWSKETFTAALKQIKTNLGYRLNSLNLGTAGIPDSQYNPVSATETPPANSSLPTPQSRDDFDQLNSGDHYISPDDGQEYVKP